MTSKQKVSLANRILRLKGRAKTLHVRKDVLFDKLCAGAKPGEVIETEQGPMTIHDNFATKNVAYRPAGVHRLELKEFKTATAKKEEEVEA